MQPANHPNMSPYDLLSRPFNLVVATFFLLASVLSYNSTISQSIYIVLINLIFASLSIIIKHKRSRISGIIHLLGGAVNIFGAQLAPDSGVERVNQALFALGGAIFGAGVLWYAMVLHRKYIYERTRRVRLGDDEEASMIDEEAEESFETKTDEDRARDVISEMIERSPPLRIEVQLQVERVERRD